MADTELQEVALAKKDLSNEEKTQFDVQYAPRRKNPTTALILSLFLGTVGVDRFYIGDTGLGFAKLFTLGGLWIWSIVDWFKIQKAARTRNTDTIREIHDVMVQMRGT